LLERGGGDTAPDPAVVEHKWSMFLELIRWAEGGSCRHDAILRYFGDEAETLAGCGRCDVCLALDDAPDAGDPERVTLIVRKALSGVARVHGRFGLQLAVKLIHGDADERLQRAGLTKVPTFGNLKEEPVPWLVALLRRCVSAGWVSFAGVDRPVVTLTEEGRAVMKGQHPARLLLPPATHRGVAGRVGPRRAKLVASPVEPAVSTAQPDASRAPGLVRGRAPAAKLGGAGVELDAAGIALFEALRRHRLALARAEGVAPFIVASDRTLRDIAALRPRDLTELERAHGVGPHKVARYGAGLLKVVADVVGSAAWTSS
jgi:ATP-dependent DNA helicase RecQ